MTTTPPDPGAKEPPDTASSVTVLAGSAWLAAGLLLPLLFIVVQSIVAARILGPDAFGRQSYIAWAEITAIALATGGLPLALMRQTAIARSGGRSGEIPALFNLAWRLQLISAVLAALALVVAGWLRNELRAAWVLASIACAMVVMHSVANALLIGLQRWRDSTLIGLASGAAGTVAVVIALLLDGGITGMFAIEALVVTANMVWTRRLARRALPAVAEEAPRPRDVSRHMLAFAGLASLHAIFVAVVWSRLSCSSSTGIRQLARSPATRSRSPPSPRSCDSRRLSRGPWPPHSRGCTERARLTGSVTPSSARCVCSAR